MPTILVVDDSSTVRAHLRAFLEQQGFTVFEAANGAEGVAMTIERSPDLLIMDINMPIMDGLTAVEKVRQLPRHTSTPIFMLTTETSRQIAARAKAIGATAWMVKPCNLEVLLRGVRGILAVATCA